MEWPTLFLAAPIIVGNQRLSRVSIRRNTASCSSIRSSRSLTSSLIESTDDEGTTWPGIGIESDTPRAFCNKQRVSHSLNYQRKDFRESVNGAHHSRKYQLQAVGCCLGLRLASREAVIKAEQRLSDRIGEWDGGIVDKRDVPHTPSLDTRQTERVRIGSDSRCYSDRT